MRRGSRHTAGRRCAPLVKETKTLAVEIGFFLATRRGGRLVARWALIVPARLLGVAEGRAAMARRPLSGQESRVAPR
jgi:hypothetical protein